MRTHPRRLLTLVQVCSMMGLALALPACVQDFERKVLVTAGTDAAAPEDGGAEDVVPDLPGELAAEVDSGPDVDAGGTDLAVDVAPEVADVAPQEAYQAGPEGGEFLFPSGVSVSLPAGALDETVTLTVSQAAAAGPDKLTAVTGTWKLEPAGTQLALPAIVKLPLGEDVPAEVPWPRVSGFAQVGVEKWDEMPAWPVLAEERVWLQTRWLAVTVAGVLPEGGGEILDVELCDGKDNDGDGLVDEAADLDTSDEVTGCPTNTGVCKFKFEVSCVGGEWVCEQVVEPVAGYEPDGELSCDGQDNDCDGAVDEEILGSVSELVGLGIEVQCKSQGVCEGANIFAVCGPGGKWVCDYMKVNGFQGAKESTCDQKDNDCDGTVDEGTCGALEPCTDDGTCLEGHCVLPLEGMDQKFCTADPTGCLAVNDEAELVAVAEGAQWCLPELARLAVCEDGEWPEEAHYNCKIDFDLNTGCDTQTHVCTGGCAQDSECVDDGDLCNGVPICVDGLCQTDPDSVLIGTCDDGSPCTLDQCAPQSGECTHTPHNNGGSCDDQDPCTGVGSCQDGVCAKGTAKSCDDGNSCTADSCAPETGECVHDPAPMLEALCDDGSACTAGDVCTADGSCAGQPVSCDDSNPCTADSCDPATGECVYQTLVGEPCDDGDLCTSDGVCNADSVCIVQTLDCNDDNDCTEDSCLAGECVHTPKSLVPTPPICAYPDAQPGNQDICIPLGQCDAEGVCQPGDDYCECHDDEDCLALEDDLCDGIATCELENGVYACVFDPATVVTCDPATGNPCTKNVCVPATGACEPVPVVNGKSCNDNDSCTINDACVDGVCVGPDPKVCNDQNQCTTDTCDAVFGCKFTPVTQGTPCDDGDPCTTGDACSAPAQAACVPGTPMDPPCDDGDPCTVDTCTPNGAECLFVPIEGCCETDEDCLWEEGEVCADSQCCLPVCWDDALQVPYQCGSDGCAGSCGTCGNEDVCFDHQCCTPNCSNPLKLCGDDGCGGSCGACGDGQVCTAQFECCEPSCEGRECGDDGCGGSCGECLIGDICEPFSGQCEPCIPQCTGKQCGPDGCGGECGSCGNGDVCLEAGTCCTPQCDGLMCGDDGCGGSCGECLGWQACDAGECVCAQCCDLNDDCDPFSTCTGEVEHNGDTLALCQQQMAVYYEGFEGLVASQPVPDFEYEWVGAIPWTVKLDPSGLNTFQGDYSFRYYKVGGDGKSFYFDVNLPELEAGQSTLLSFYSRCTNANVVFSMQVFVNEEPAPILTLDNAGCDKLWHRRVADLSAYSGIVKLRFKTTKNVVAATELLIDELAILSPHCPQNVPCADYTTQEQVCVVDSVSFDQCLIDYVCYPDEAVNPEVGCAVCKSANDQFDWTPDNSLCTDGTNGVCSKETGCSYQ